ncbi:hypothetical protein CCACVL1_28856 [Corchorus capsularis]|uniref:Uncharacterized protein n=1 Tax=Corchorus capsularis TaxID=210143 RepID=A0A1R3G4Y0_COCAP|nr:hypothetical protein CCACVL1_28856 [Corchorus capsularis]
MESSGNVSGTNIESDSKTDKVVSPSPRNQDSHVSATENPSPSSAGATKLDNSPGTSTSNNGGIRTEEEMPVSSMPKSGDGSPMVTSPTQAADQQPSVASSPSPNSSRIPSYVFARNKSSGNMEWSVASNESLFSIQMGNASFTTDQMSWMSKSGELGYTFDPTFSGPLMDLPVSCQTPTRISTEQAIAKKSCNLNEGYGATEAAAAETMREVLREKEAEAKANTAKESAHSRNLSHTSDSSIKSFAFPM